MRALSSSLVLAVASGSVFFKEDFSSGWESRWVHSEWKKAEGTQGKFDAVPGKWFKDESNLGLHTTDNAKFYTISAQFPTFSNEGKEVIFQYQVKYEQEVDCGGGYLKFGPKLDDQKAFGDPTPYNIMFGPDQCGHTKRTHLIFSYKGKNLLKTADLPFRQRDKFSHVYRLTLKPDNTCSVEIDEEEVYNGSLYDDWEFLAPRQIPDPAVSKPADWVDIREIDDPEDKKPDDWVDEELVADPDAEKPEDWDDETDGEWERPMITNPAYKGEWRRKRIPNPEYKGEWKAPMIDNPEFVDDPALYLYKDFSFVGIDLWQVKAGSIFDNIIITDDKAEADKLVTEWKELTAVEKEMKQAEDDRMKAEAEARVKNAGSDEADDDEDDMSMGDDEDL